MHESGLIKNMLKIVEQVQREHQMRPVEGLTVEIAEFGGLTEEHFRFHFEEETRGTVWEGLILQIKKVPVGEEAKLVSVRFKE